MSELRRSVREGHKVWLEVARGGRPLVRPLTLPWEPHSHMLYTDSIVPRCTCASARQNVTMRSASSLCVRIAFKLRSAKQWQIAFK